MTVEELQRIYDNAIRLGQSIVKGENDLITAFSMVVAYHGNIDKVTALGATLMPVHAVDSLDDQAIVILFRPWPATWQDRYGVLRNAISPEHRDIVDTLLVTAEAIAIDDPFMRVARPMMETMGLNDKDVARLALEQICHAVDAVAIINVTTAWSVIANHGDLDSKGSFADDPASVEVLLVSLESLALDIVTMFPIQREPAAAGSARDAGRFVGWGPPHSYRSDDGKAHNISGRFRGLLKPLRPAHA